MNKSSLFLNRTKVSISTEETVKFSLVTKVFMYHVIPRIYKSLSPENYKHIMKRSIHQISCINTFLA